MVVWPGFRYDLWGTRPVLDKVYEEAMAWTAKHIEATAARLSAHLEEVIDRVCGSRLLKANYYADEVVARMRQMWAPPPIATLTPNKLKLSSVASVVKLHFASKDPVDHRGVRQYKGETQKGDDLHGP